MKWMQILDEDMKQIDEFSRKKPLTLQILQMQQKTTDKTENTDSRNFQILLQKNLRIKLKHQIPADTTKSETKRKLKNKYKGLSLELYCDSPDHISVIIRKEPRSSVRSHP